MFKTLKAAIVTVATMSSLSALASIGILGYKTKINDDGFERLVFLGVNMRNMQPEVIRLDILNPMHVERIEACEKSSQSGHLKASRIYVDFNPQYVSDVRIFDPMRMPERFPDEVIVRSVQCDHVGPTFKTIWTQALSKVLKGK